MAIYDAAILGDALAGLVAAAHLQRRGLRAVWVSLQHLTPPPDHAPAPYPGALARSFLAGTALEDALSQVPRAPVSYQALMPSHRADMHRARPSLLRELAREFPDAAAGFDAALQKRVAAAAPFEAVLRELREYPRQGFFVRRRWRQFFDGPGKAAAEPPGVPPLAAPGSPAALAFGALEPFIAPYPPWPGLLHAHAGLLEEGVVESPDGYPRMAGIFRRQLADKGMKVMDEIKAAGIALQGGKARGVAWGERSNNVPAQCVIYAGPLGLLAGLLPPQAVGGKYWERLAARPAVRYRLDFRLVARRGCLPVGLDRRAVILPHDGGLPDPYGGFLVTTPEEAHAARGRPSDPADVFITAHLPPPGMESEASRARIAGATAAQIIGQLHRYMPFLDEHLLGVAAGIPLMSRPVSAPEALEPVNCAAHFGPDPEIPGNLGGAPFETPVDGLYAASPEILPNLGIAGEFLLGKIVAETAMEALARRRKG